jgi:hypothetical protein
LGSVLRGATRAIYANGRLASVEGATITIAMANAPTRARAEQSRVDVEAALSTAARTPVTVRLIDEAGAPAAPTGSAAGTGSTSSDHDDHDEMVDVSELDDAPAPAASGLDRIRQAFPGATLVNEETP